MCEGRDLYLSVAICNARTNRHLNEGERLVNSKITLCSHANQKTTTITVISILASSEKRQQRPSHLSSTMIASWNCFGIKSRNFCKKWHPAMNSLFTDKWVSKTAPKLSSLSRSRGLPVSCLIGSRKKRLTTSHSYTILSGRLCPKPILFTAQLSLKAVITQGNLMCKGNQKVKSAIFYVPLCARLT